MTSDRPTLTDSLEDLEGTIAHEADQLQRCVLALASAVLRVEQELKTQRLEAAARRQGEEQLAQSLPSGVMARFLGWLSW